MEHPDIRHAVGRPRGDQPIFLPCPSHGDEGRPNLAVYADGTYCFSCGFKETPEEFLERVAYEGTLPPRRERNRVRVADYRPPDYRSRVELWHQTLIAGPRRSRLDYLHQRGIWLQTIHQQKIGHTGDHFVIPVWQGTTILGYRLRRDDVWADPDEPKYKSPAGQPNLLYRPNPNAGIVIVTEGEFDALLLSQYGYDALTYTNGSQSLGTGMSTGTWPSTVYVATDQDPPGDRAAREIAHKTKARCQRLRFDGKDVSDALMLTPLPERADAIRRWIATAEGIE